MHVSTVLHKQGIRPLQLFSAKPFAKVVGERQINMKISLKNPLIQAVVDTVVSPRHIATLLKKVSEKHLSR